MSDIGPYFVAGLVVLAVYGLLRLIAGRFVAPKWAALLAMLGSGALAVGRQEAFFVLAVAAIGVVDLLVSVPGQQDQRGA